MENQIDKLSTDLKFLQDDFDKYKRTNEKFIEKLEKQKEELFRIYKEKMELILFKYI
jgi:hypothetical protein